MERLPCQWTETNKYVIMSKFHKRLIIMIKNYLVFIIDS